MQKSYAHKIKKDQDKYTVPADDINPEPTIVKKVVDGSTEGTKGSFYPAPKPQGGNRMRKTIYTYADK